VAQSPPAVAAEIIDVLPAFCASAVCPTVIADQIAYADSSHLTASYAKSLVPYLQPTLEDVLAD
jgi:SGNH domain (fused to AT3 domains)